MEKTENVRRWRIISLLLVIALIAVSTVFTLTVKCCKTPQLPAQTASVLASWNDEAPLKRELTDYVKAVTTKGSADFIPVEDRIAVFDLDGTLACETDPCYFDHCIYYYRVMEDPDYKDKASDFEKEVAAEVKQFMDTGVSPEDLMERHGKAVASAFEGLTPEEFVDYAAEFAKTPSPGYNGMTRAEAFYKPMLEVVDYLEDNGFTVYVVSGTDRFLVRGLVKNSPLKLPFSQIIGSDESLVSTEQEEVDGLGVQFDENDQLVLGGDFLIKNLDMNKVSVIQQEIGKQPVLSFGNSGTDSSMAEYTITDNRYPAKAFMLCCDDTERENGNTEKAEKMKKSCEENGWTAISMKNDWKTIYGDGVARK